MAITRPKRAVALDSQDVSNLFFSQTVSWICPPKSQDPKNASWLVVEPTHLKNMLVKLGNFPKFQGENTIKYLKPPARFTGQSRCVRENALIYISFHIFQRGHSADQQINDISWSPGFSGNPATSKSPCRSMRWSPMAWCWKMMLAETCGFLMKHTKQHVTSNLHAWRQRFKRHQIQPWILGYESLSLSYFRRRTSEHLWLS